MKNRMIKTLGIFGIIFATASAWAGTQSIRAVNLDQKIWNDVQQGKIINLVVEFRQGDRLSVVFQAQGDFLETSEPNPIYMTVKQAFWMKLSQNQVQMSLDGTHFKSVNDLVKGTITAGASSDPSGNGIANAIQLMLKAEIK